MKELNVGPTASGISVIKDAILTVYSQATLRYTAKLTLGAHLPGNGMGGSTKPTAIINPAISTGVTACGVNQIGKAVADCSKSSGCTPQEAGAPKSSDNNGKNLRKTKNNNAGLTYPTSAQYAVNSDGTVKQPTSGCTNLRANALGVGNSLATTEWAQFP